MDKPDSQVVMPDKAEGAVPNDGIVGVVIQHIRDDIEDRRTLRDWRKWIAGLLTLISIAFYAVFFSLLKLVVCDLERYKPILEARFLSVAVVAALVVVPTLLLLIVAKAVFGMSKTSGEVPSSPLQAILHLMKEIRG